jgi:hypothetical protein
VGSRDPIARFCGALFAGLNGQTEHRGLELSSEHNPNPSSSCIAKGQFGNGRLWEYSPLAWKRRDMLFCCATSYMIHLQKKITQVRFGTALLHELASLYMYAIFRCSSRHAVDRQNRGKVPQTAGLLLARMQREKDFACSCTPTHQSTTQENPLCGLLAKLPIRFSVRATVCRTARPRGLPGFSNVCNLLQFPCSANHKSRFSASATPPQNLLNSRATNHRGRRASDRRRSRQARARAEKRNVWNWKACRLPGR